MNGARRLYELYLIDSESQEHEDALKEVERKLKYEETLKRIRGRVGDQEKELSSLERQQREADSMILSVQSKLTPLEQKVYSGSVKNPRELEAFEQETKSLKKQLSRAEDKSLSFMDCVDAAQNALAGAREELAAIEKQRLKEVQRLSSDKNRIEKELLKLRPKRQGLISIIDAGDLRLYESLRSTKSGSAVGKVERGMCQGCRIALPMSVVQQARLGRNVVQCTSCGRILYLS